MTHWRGAFGYGMLLAIKLAEVRVWKNRRIHYSEPAGEYTRLPFGESGENSKNGKYGQLKE
ncbi:hypothetical protein [Marvinbryantia formatexigens]|nr:hypothetical protein [Marvinbryantia formatexigens]